LVGLTLAASVGAMVVLNTGARIGVGPLIFGFADGYDGAAFRMTQSAAPSSEALARAEVKARRAQALSPYDNTARLRLAYIDTLRHGALFPKGVALYIQSYELLPYDQDVAAWRIRFGLEHWASLSPEARIALHEEVMTFAKVGSRDPDLRTLLASIRDPSGRLAAALWLPTLAL
jgi:hypothetical protein